MYESNNAVDVARNEYLLQLWSSQLNRPNLGFNEDYFEAGGSSMQLVEMLMTIADKFGKEIDFEEFMKEPSIRKLSQLLED
jgi:acyl carrier protein